MFIQVTQAEHAAILTALQLYRDQVQIAVSDPVLKCTASDNDSCEPLATQEQIDDLAEKVNVDVAPKVLVHVRGGIASAIGDDGVHVFVFDQDNFDDRRDDDWDNRVPKAFAKLAEVFSIPAEAFE